MKNNRIMWIVSFIPLVMSAAVYKFLPDQMPMHYDLAGNVDRWGSKAEIFIFPVIILSFTVMWQCMIGYYGKKAAKSESEKEKAQINSNIKVLKVTATAMAAGFGLMNMLIIYIGYTGAVSQSDHASLDFNTAINVIMGIVIVFIGNYIPKTKRNSAVGFRTAKSMSNDVIWAKSNRFAGMALMVAGVVIVVEAILVGGILSTILMVITLLIATIVSAIYTAKL